jgi:hypothetical protein
VIGYSVNGLTHLGQRSPPSQKIERMRAIIAQGMGDAGWDDHQGLEAIKKALASMTVGGSPKKKSSTMKNQQPFGFAGMPVLPAQVSRFNGNKVTVAAHLLPREIVRQMLKGKIRKPSFIPVQGFT